MRGRGRILLAIFLVACIWAFGRFLTQNPQILEGLLR